MSLHLGKVSLAAALVVSAVLGTTTTASARQSWTAGASATTPIVRGQGAWFPANGRFYVLGGRSADTAGSDLVNPSEYNPGTNTWATKAGVFPTNQVNNMVGGVLTDAGTPYVYCVGGSAAGAATSTPTLRRYDPVADVVTTVATDPWPATANTLPGGGAVFNNKLYVFGGFTISVGMTSQVWEFDPAGVAGARWTLKTATLPVAMGYIPVATVGSLIYIGAGTTFSAGSLFDSANSYVYDPVADTIAAIASTPRATGETRAVNEAGQVWVLGGGRVLPNPGNQVDAYDPGTNTWSLAPAFVTARRNIAADVDPLTGNIYMVGGYAPTTATSNMEIFFHPFANFCAGDGSGTACPCANNSAPGADLGCLNSFGTGASLRATGTPSITADTVVLNAGNLPVSSTLFFQGTTRISSVFGDGLRCAGGSNIRLKTYIAAGVGGSATTSYPQAGDSTVSVRGGVTAAGTRTYQVWYRNSAPFCTADAYNLSNGLEITWQP